LNILGLFIRYGTWAGNMPPQFVICAVLLFIDFPTGYKVGSVWFYGYLINLLIKNTYRKERPPKSGWRVAHVNGFSFPSGHSLTSLLLYWSIAKYFAVPFPWAGVLYALPFFLGLSRLYLRVHFPVDVMGGWTIAILYIFFFGEKVLAWNMQFYDIFYKICHFWQ